MPTHLPRFVGLSKGDTVSMTLWDDPEMLELEDEVTAAEAGILDIDPEDLREMEADAATLARRTWGIQTRSVGRPV